MANNPMPTSPTPELSPLELIVVYDNNPYDNKLYTAHGFSCLVRLARRNILFDTGGDSFTLLYNMGQLKIDPSDVDDVFLSHIHGDHTGGLGGFLEQNSDVNIYLPQSFPRGFKNEIASIGVKVKEVSTAKELLNGVYTTGELGSGMIEQSLVLKTNQGLVVMTGCAHPGIVEIIGKAKEVVPGSRMYLAIGGFHLSGASTTEIESIISSFIQFGVQRAAPCHCSGDEAKLLFEKNYGANYIEVGVGKRIQLP
jgi:7,8-dihydropterin-6-yl-methyl-4-(beta-D-ribofuranosyl)aminobenzene 5'-phosphate synthase